MSTKGNPSKFDSLPKLADDEPYFVLRARDPVSEALVRDWADFAERQGCNPEKVAEARACAEAMRNWPTKKIPD